MQLRLFNSKMTLFGDTQITIAKYLGITRQALANKLTGKSTFRQDEIDMIITRWNLTPDDVVQIFFNNDDEC